jgi:DNA-binding transcriptional ArsR family regulator
MVNSNRSRKGTVMASELTAAQLGPAAKVLRALAHPVRLGAVQCLRSGELSVTQLYERLGCSQSMMSQQLGILEAQGLIRTRKEGTVKYCALRNPDFLKLFTCMRHHLLTVLRLPEAEGRRVRRGRA